MEWTGCHALGESNFQILFWAVTRMPALIAGQVANLVTAANLLAS